jgi:tetratricopeptide (TPR) repeat protein
MTPSSSPKLQPGVSLHRNIFIAVLWKYRACASQPINAILMVMKKLFFFSFLGSSMTLCAVAQTRDTQGVSVQLTAKNSYDKATVLNQLQNQEYDEAIGYLSPLLQADSANSALLGYAGYAYFMNEDYSSSARCYHRLLGMDSASVPALHYLLLMEISDHPADAKDYAIRLVQLQPDRAVWWRSLGEIMVQAHDKDSAMYCYHMAHVLAPHDVRTISGLADILIGEKEFTRVDSLLIPAMAFDSLNLTLNKLAVRSAYMSQRYDAALVPGERLVRALDPSIQALTWLGLSYYNLKLYPDCIRVCEHMLNLGLTQESVFYYEARAWTKLKEYRKSDSLLRIALSISIAPTTEWYYDNLGSNHDDLKEYKEAVANYDTAYYLFHDPMVLYACGRICETELRDLSRARKYYLKYLAVAKPVKKEEKEAYAYVRKRWGRK